MGNYTTQEHMDLFGGLPDADEPTHDLSMEEERARERAGEADAHERWRAGHDERALQADLDRERTD